MARRLLLLNGIAILCVILFHATGFGFTAMFSWPHRYRQVVSPNYDEVGTVAYYVLRVIEQVVVFSIPSFLFVSGYFVSVLVGRTRQTLDPRAIWARIRHLAIPYLVWSFVFILAVGLEGRVFSLGRYARMIMTGATNPNYYYVPLLIQLYLLAPLIVMLARWNWKVLLTISAVWHLSYLLLNYLVIVSPDIPGVVTVAKSLPKWLFVNHVFWFNFGVILGFHHQAFKPFLARVRPVLLPCAAILFVAGVVEWEVLVRLSGTPWVENRTTLFDALYSLAMILAFLAYTEVKLPFANVLLDLGGRSYGIYLVHGIVMEYVSRGLYHLAPWILARQSLLQPTLIVLGLGIPLVLMALVSRSPWRGVYGYVFG